MAIELLKRRKNRISSLVPGAVIRVHDLDAGPFLIHRVYRVDKNLALSVIDCNDCLVAITTTVDNFGFDLLDPDTELGTCGKC